MGERGRDRGLGHKRLQGCSADWLAISALYCDWSDQLVPCPLLCYLIAQQPCRGSILQRACGSRILIEFFLFGHYLSVISLRNGGGTSNYRKGTLIFVLEAFAVCTACNCSHVVFRSIL